MEVPIRIDQKIDVSVEMLGYKFAQISSDEQARFLLCAAEIAGGFNWCMQSSYISKDLLDLSTDKGADVIRMLETLLDHIKNPDGEEK